MKKLVLSLVFATALVHGFSQHLVLSSYMEHTTVSPKTGLSVGNHFIFRYPGYDKVVDFAIGGFYQREIHLLKDESSTPHEQVFTGAYTEWSMVNHKRFQTLLNVRLGIQNQENFLITPSLKLAYSIVDRVTVVSGIGSRGALSPTYMYGILVKL